MHPPVHRGSTTGVLETADVICWVHYLCDSYRSSLSCITPYSCFLSRLPCSVVTLVHHSAPPGATVQLDVESLASWPPSCFPPPALSRPVSPGVWVRPGNPVHLQRVCDSLENPAGNAPGPRVPHTPHRVAHHNGESRPRPAGWLLAAAFPALVEVGGRGGSLPTLSSPASPTPSPPPT